MHISELNIKGFRNFKEITPINFNEGLNVLIGENGVGKSAVIDAIRLLLREDGFDRLYISDLDFYSPFDKIDFESNNINIDAKFRNLSKIEKISYLPWLINSKEMKLQLEISNETNYRDRYNYKLWGGESSSSAFEWELINSINCVYLPPLRDAESKLQEGRGSRLAKFLKFVSKDELEDKRKENELHSLEKKVSNFNEELCDDEEGIINEANEYIRSSLRSALGSVFSQDTYLQFSEVNFNRIVEGLRLLFYPDINTDSISKKHFRSLEQNSLGYNNLLYIAVILAELTMIEDRKKGFKVLLIEEPEAHLHPQIQNKLLKYLNKVTKEKNIQIFITTHSPIIASSVSINKIIHFSETKNKLSQSVSINNINIPQNSLTFINRWLDVTKSVMFFSKGIILVEGIAEALLLPELAKIVLEEFNKIESNSLPSTLNEAGVTVVNMNGIYFKHFMQLFYSKDGNHIPMRCSGITDLDPPKDKFPSNPSEVEGTNPALDLIESYNESDNCRLYANELKTFEYDLAMVGDNLTAMFEVLVKIWPNDSKRVNGVKNNASKYSSKDWAEEDDKDKIGACKYLLEKIEDSKVGKGYYAQKLASYISNENSLSVPEYIKKAVIWSCGGELDG